MGLSARQGGSQGSRVCAGSALSLIARACSPRSEEETRFFRCIFETKARRSGRVSFRKPRGAPPLIPPKCRAFLQVSSSCSSRSRVTHRLPCCVSRPSPATPMLSPSVRFTYYRCPEWSWTEIAREKSSYLEESPTHILHEK